MAATRSASKRPGSPIGKKGQRKANPKYKRRSRQPWSDKEIKQLRSFAKANTPTGVYQSQDAASSRVDHQ
ncbi:hypothetical protein [Bradyrhizobium sp. AZCC 1721]|uniref:hypothetical protein n=1 Tax=Bradyrhizobium sp. AZCC 1721 TaxID=3117016 RepID=UPI002FF059AC